MLVKIKDDKPSPLIGSVIAYKNKPTKVNDIDALKTCVENGRKLVIRDGDTWVEGKEYFNEMKKATVKADIEVKEESNNYEDIFEGHWTKQVKKVKKYDSPEEVKSILEYAKENDVSDGVLGRVEEYL